MTASRFRTRMAIVSLLAAAMLAPARAEEWTDPETIGRTELSDVPWDPKALEEAAAIEPKVIYGSDDRIDVYQETNQVRLSLAASTCALVSAARVSPNGSGGFNLQTSAFRVFGLPACNNEPFGAQPVASFCSGFLVAPDVVATAGHCINTNDLPSTRIVFGFKMTSSSNATTSFSASQVYTPTQLLCRVLSSDLDYSVIKLDRAVTAPGAAPLQVRTSGTVPLDTPLGVIGHPSGLPMKIAFGSATKVYDTSNSAFFVANLDAYGGNSGSPVFNATTGVVEGILVRGNSDYLNQGTCFISRVLSNGAAGEESTKITAVPCVPTPTPVATPSPSPSPSLTPSISPTPFNNASFAEQSAPETIESGEQIFASVTLRNTGDSAWSAAAGYSLSVLSDSCSALPPSTTAIAIPAGESIPPGAIGVFVIAITAPAEPGACALQFRMSQAAQGAFGETALAQFSSVAPANDARDWGVYE